MHKIIIGAIALSLSAISSGTGTVDIVIKTPECVVFASDSRSTHPNTAIASDTYEKIVKVSRFVMAQTAGFAMPGNKNLRTTLQEFKWRYGITDSSTLDIETLVERFVEYCNSNKSAGVNYKDFLISFAGPDTSGNIHYC